MAEQEILDSEGGRPPQGKDKIDRWVAEIDKWVNKIDRSMGEGRAASDAYPGDEEAGSPPDPAPELLLFSVLGRCDSLPNWGTLARNGRDPHHPYFAGPNAQENRVRIMVVENHQVVADGLAELLNAHSDMVVVGSAKSVAEASVLASDLEPDVVLTDFHLSDGTGADALVAIRRTTPDARFIFLTREDGDAARLAALEGGASAFIHKSHGAEDIVGAIRIVAEGGTLFTPDVVASLLKQGRETHAQRESLTPREKEVLRLLAAATSSRDIATRLGISYTTVRAHLRSIDAKLGVHSKVEAVLKARELGILE